MLKQLKKLFRPNHQADEARQAAALFIEVFFGPERVGDPEVFELETIQLAPFSHLQALPDGRKNGNAVIDYYSPSFWHACCAVLYRWNRERRGASLGKSTITTYRGQANTWPLQPSAWRSSIVELGEQPLETIREFLASENWDTRNDNGIFFPEQLGTRSLKAFSQHHEFPTSLIDISFNPLVALYFASRDCAPQAVSEEVKGMGVVYECIYNNFEALGQNTGIRAEMIMLPPEHVFRIYQQQGFFVDFGYEPNKQITQNVELACEKIFFPRDYPSMSGISDIFSEEKIMRYLNK